MKKSSVLFLFILPLIASGCSVFGIRTSEELKYSVVDEAKPFQIRTYEPHLAAVATSKGD